MFAGSKRLGARESLQDSTLNSFIDDTRHDAISVSDEKHIIDLSGGIFSAPNTEPQDRDSVDSEKREAEIMRVLRHKSEESEDDSHFDITDITGGSHHFHDDDEEEEEDEDGVEVYNEASEHLRNLLESVTQKLLQRPRQEDSQGQEESDFPRLSEMNGLNSSDNHKKIQGGQNQMITVAESGELDNQEEEEQINVTCIGGWELREQESLPVASEKSHLLGVEDQRGLCQMVSKENDMDTEKGGEFSKEVVMGEEAEKC